MGTWEIPRSGTCLNHLVEAGVRRGVELSDLLTRASLDAARMSDPTTLFSSWQQVAVAENLVDALPNEGPHLGLELGGRTHAASFGVLGLALLTSATLGEALGTVKRFAPLVPTVTRIKMTSALGETTLDFDGSLLPDKVRRLLVERDLALSLTVLRDITDGQVRYRRLEIGFPADGSRGSWGSACGARPRFGAERTRFVVAESQMDKALPQADQHANWLATRDSQELLARRTALMTVSDQVLERMWSSAPRLPSLEELAASLTTTTRTLRRRLASEGTSFRALNDEVRLRSAMKLLDNGRLSVQQIASELGYSDPPAFTAAFRRWTGASPRAYRKRNVAGTDATTRAIQARPEQSRRNTGRSSTVFPRCHVS